MPDTTSFSTIQIYRSWPVINNYVQVPTNKNSPKTRITVDQALLSVLGSEVVELSLGSGKSTGSKFGTQEFLRLPPVNADSHYTTDPVDDAYGV